jgi:hypothetical protein
MSSETRVVRPYLGAHEFQHMLDSCALQCANQTIEGGGEIALGLDEYLNAPFVILLNGVSSSRVDSGAAALDLDPGDIDLLVLVAAPRLRFVDTVFQSDLSKVNDLPNRIPLSLPARPRALRAPHGGADVRIYFCLNKFLEKRPLTPWRKGTWLAQKEFRVRSDLSGSGFVPIRMTDEDREHLGVPKETARFATLDDNDPFDPEPATDVVKLYVDGDLLDRLAVAAGTPVGKHIQRQLFVDATAAIVFAAHGRLAEEPSLRTQHVDDFRGSLVHKLTEVVAGSATDAVAPDLRQAAYQRMCDAPTTFIAQIEAKTGIRNDMLVSLEDVR